MKDFVKKIIKKNKKLHLLTIRVISKYNHYRKKRYYHKQYRRYNKISKNVRDKNIINVAFFALYSSSWKYDYLYRLFSAHPRFNPIVFVCPIVNYGYEHMMMEMNNTYNEYKKKGYNVVKTFNEADMSYINIKEKFDVDIVFYTNPYKGLIHDKYYITNYLDTLTSYVSYNYGNSCDYDNFHNLELHNLVWRLYAESAEHKIYSEKHSTNSGENVIVTGYPGVDPLLFPDRTSLFDWKCSDTNCKKIIWAPHHTFEPAGEKVFYSCFLKYAQFMLDMCKKYSEKIQIAFKPHPLLRPKLNNYWGKERTDNYFNAWENLSNGMYVEGEYIDLFLSSDAMIHDCGSFLIEYLCTGKPVMRTNNGEDITQQLNPFALKCLSVYYQANNEYDIEEFILNLINGKDVLKKDRLKFIQKNLLPYNNKPASQNIFNDIIHSLSLKDV